MPIFWLGISCLGCSYARELVEFYESMDSVQFSKVQKFFETMPKLTHTIEVFNPKTEVTSPIVLEGLASFFA